MPKLNLQPALETRHERESSKTELINDTTQIPWYKRPKTWLKIFFLIGIITLTVLAIVFNKTTVAVFTSFLTWFQENLFIGAISFMFIYWIATVLFIPGSLLTLGAGFVFSSTIGIIGTFVATLVVWLGASLGASTAFLLGRSVLRDQVEEWKKKSEKFDLIDKVVELNGLKVTFLLRLSPIVPFNLFNYFMGLTSVKFRDYNIALLGMIPGTLAYCFVGGSLGSLASASGVGFSNPTILIFTIVGTVIAIIGMILVGIYGKKQFAKLAAEVEKNKENENNDAINDTEKQDMIETDENLKIEMGDNVQNTDESPEARDTN